METAFSAVLTICVKIHEAAKQAKENEASFPPNPRFVGDSPERA